LSRPFTATMTAQDRSVLGPPLAVYTANVWAEADSMHQDHQLPRPEFRRSRELCGKFQAAVNHL